MIAVVTDQSVGNAHLMPNGEHWPLALGRETDLVFSDSASDLVGLLIPGYPTTDQDADDATAERDADDALKMRWHQAIGTAAMVQASLCATAVSEDTFDPATTGDEALTVLFADKDVPVDCDQWPADLPSLVLVTTDYYPFTDRIPPAGNVLWIDPADEMAYLKSLATLGVVAFYTADDI